MHNLFSEALNAHLIIVGEMFSCTGLYINSRWIAVTVVIFVSLIIATMIAVYDVVVSC